MGEYAEMMLDGTCCSQCGEYLGGDEGYPVVCAGCAPRQKPQRHKRQQKPAPKYPTGIFCPMCGKQFPGEHNRDDHLKHYHKKLMALTDHTPKAPQAALAEAVAPDPMATPTPKE